MKFLNNVDVNSNNVFFTDSVMGTSESLYPNATDSIVIYSLNASDYLGAKFLVKTISGTDQSIREILAMYDDSQGYITEYAIVSTTETGIYNDTYTFVFSSDTSTYDLVLTPSVSGERNVHVFSTGIVPNAIDYYAPVSSDFSPLGISGLVLWLDAADTSTITESGGSVSQWDDKSGNGYDVVQATAANQPTTGVTTLNSLNVLDWDSTQTMTNSTFSLSQPFTVLGVIQHDQPFAAHRWLGSSNSINIGTNLSSGYLATAGTTVVGGLASTSPTFESVVFDGASSVFYANSVQEFTGDFGSNSFTNFTLGSTGFAFKGFIAEVLVFDGVLSTADRTEVETYLQSKWNL